MHISRDSAHFFFLKAAISMRFNGVAVSHSIETVVVSADKRGAPVIIPCPCRLAGCTGCQTAGLRRSRTGCTGCATPRCFHPPGYCSSASTPARSPSDPTAPDRRKCAPGPEQAACRPPLSLHRRQRRSKGSRWSCNWRPLLRPDRRSLRHRRRRRRPLPTLHRRC